MKSKGRRRLPFPDEAKIQCQFCNQTFTIRIDPSGGAEQHFEYDCEICCRPLIVHVSLGEDGVRAYAVRGDG